jgi:hypothetical protein
MPLTLLRCNNSVCFAWHSLRPFEARDLATRWRVRPAFRKIAEVQHASRRFTSNEPIICGGLVHPAQSFTFEHESVINGLSRTCVVRVESCEPLDLAGRNCDGMFQNEPGHVFGAGRSGQGSGESIVAPVCRQEIRCIDRYAVVVFFFVFFLWQVAPELLSPC